jgi:orotate phosphoribosyltransferase
MASLSFDLPRALLEAGAVRLSPSQPFTWASGLKSPIYCDNRLLLGLPQARAQIAGALAGSIEVMSAMPTLVAGASTAGIPWAALAAAQLGLPMAYVRPEPKTHGMGRQVEGPSADGHKVVLIEDLISTGGSSIRCVEALRAEGAQVLCVLALFSYGLSIAKSAFVGAGLQCISLATFPALLERAVEMGAIEKESLQTLENWRRDPKAWSDAQLRL